MRQICGQKGAISAKLLCETNQIQPNLDSGAAQKQSFKEFGEF